MHSLIVEEHPFGEGATTKDIARHMYARINCGQIVIVTDKPIATLSALRKQWLMLIAKVRRERSSTLDSALIYELTRTIAHMESLRFTARWHDDSHPANVYLATIDQLLVWPPESNCRTLYIACNVTREQLHMVTAWMVKGSVVVIL